MKKWSKEEITKRLDNLRKVCSNYFVDQAIMYGKFKTTNEVDALHFAFYWLKDNKLKYRREIFGKPNKIVLETDSPKWYYNDYNSLYPNTVSGVSLRQYDSGAYTITTAANTANYAVQYMPIYNTTTYAYTTAINEL